MSARAPIAALMLALLVSGCGSSISPSPSTPRQAPAVKATTGEIRSCVSGQLELGWVGTNGAPGHLEAIFSLRNRSTTPCTLQGYPASVLLDGRGRRLPLHVAPGGGAMPDSRLAPRPVQLAPGRAAVFSLSFADNSEYGGGSKCPVATRLSSVPPGTSSALALRLAGAGRPRVAPCGGSVVSSPIYTAAAGSR